MTEGTNIGDEMRQPVDPGLDIKRHAYMDAAEATGKLLEYLSVSSRMDASEDKRFELTRDCSGLLNRVHIVGNKETIIAFGEVQLCFVSRLMGIESRRFEVAQKAREIQGLREQIDSFTERQARIAEILQGVGREIGFDASQSIPNSLLVEFQGIGARIQGLRDALDECYDALLDLQLKLSNEALEGGLEVVEKFAVAVLAARAELGLDLDEEWYRDFMNQGNNRVRAEFDRLLSDLGARISGAANPGSQADA
jgi:hypothetical protein